MEPEVVVKCCVRNLSNLVYCKVISRCGHRGFGLRLSTPSTSTSSSPLQSSLQKLTQCTPKRVSVVSRFLAYDFVPRVNDPPFIPQKPFLWEHLKLKPMESTFTNLLTTNKAIITKVDQSIKLIKYYINH